MPFLLSLTKSFSYAVQGFLFAFKTQRNMRIHVLAAGLVCILGIIFEVELHDLRWLLACIALVWFAELLNSAFEYLCDVVMPDYHEGVKRAKDIAAAAVLTCSLFALLIGMLTFWPYIS